MTDYRRAFRLALAFNAVLALGLVIAWWRWHPKRMPVESPEGARAAVDPVSVEATGNEMGKQASNPGEVPLVPVQLTPQRMQSIGVKTGVVDSKSVQSEIRTVGDVEVDETRLAYVQVRFPGWIQKVFADSTYQYVRKGQCLFTIYSPDLVTTEQEYLLARQNRNELAQSSIPGVAAGAASLLDAAAERLKQWQVPDREIALLESTGKVRRELEIDSPVSGYITERNAIPNMYVQPETKLYSVADFSTVWVYAQVFQSDMASIRLGDPATVATDAYPGRIFRGRVSYVWPQLDMTTRTQRVRLVFSNPGMKLTPGMYVNISLSTPMGRHFVIPASGIFHSGTRSIAFIDHGGGYLEPREIEVGPQAGEEVIIVKGLKEGERIVTSANFLIDSESQLQAAMGAFAPPPPGAGATAAMNAPSSQANVEFSSQPSPPHKGGNIFRVKLASNGAPVSGAVVTVTFFMPAMPAMGMAAMRTVIKLSDKSGGNYEGEGALESGGSWQVTIVAQKNGETIASKVLSVNAEGGM
jgi:Cu(I)/Ag(I) efflux system membrane fusion protein/cobalt-zinc-cadmium efflux system membrane fusion protein